MSRTSYVSSKIISVFTEADSYVIGFAKIHGNIELIIEKNKDTFTTLSIGWLLGCGTTLYSTIDKKDCIFMFPRGKTLADIKQDPMAMNDMINKLKK